MLWVIICYTLMFWVTDLQSCTVINLILLEDGIANYCSFIYVTDVIVTGGKMLLTPIYLVVWF